MSTPSGQGPQDQPSAPIAPIPQQPNQQSGQSGRPKSQAASIVWAIATIVVALVGGFLIYTAITQDDEPVEAGPAATQDDASQDDAGDAATDETADGAEGATGSDTTNGSGDAATGDATGDAETGPVAQDAAEGATGPDAEGEQATGQTTGQPTEQPGEQQTMSPEQRQYLLDLPRRDPDDPLAKGEVDAPVVIIEYADYRCPFCASWGREVQPALQDLIDDGTVRLEFRDRVLFGEDSEATALAARAAGEQGMFWEFHDAVFAAAPASGHPDMPREKLIGFAEEIGIPDLARFEEDLDSDELREALQADMAEADSLGIRSTPTFLVNATPLVGAQPEPVFRQVIAHELDLAGQ